MTFSFKNEELEAKASKLKIFISKKKIKYKNEFVPYPFNPDNYCCNDNYRQYKNQIGQEIENIKTINLLNYPTEEWITETFLFEVPDDGFNWIVFDLNNDETCDVEDDPHCCALTEYLWLDKLELTEHPYCNTEEEPCSPTDGPINASYPEQIENHSNVRVTGLDNVKSATNIKIRTIQGQVIEELDDRYCINGIDTIVWDGLNLAPALYVWQMTLENDCGEQSYWRGFIYHNDELPSQNLTQICNNSIQTPIPCCESEPDIYIEDETIEGPGELSFHAIHNIEVENTTVEANTEKLVMKAGNKITLKPGTHIKEGAHAHFYIEPCTTTNTHEALLPETPYTIPMAEMHDKKIEKENKDAKASIYPNPCSSVLHVNISSDYGKQITCEIFDLNGVSVLQKTFNCRFSHCSETISTAHLTPGMYIVKLTGNDKIKSFKIVKQ
ncbi:MAG: T9SS type A sorting domain-containing protein [Bacteroidales bacterium]